MSAISKPKKFTEKETELCISMYLKGKSVPEIAKKLNRSEGSIYSKISRERTQNPERFEVKEKVSFFRTEEESINCLRDTLNLELNTEDILKKHKLNDEEELGKLISLAKEYIAGRTSYSYDLELYEEIIK